MSTQNLWTILYSVLDLVHTFVSFTEEMLTGHKHLTDTQHQVYIVTDSDPERSDILFNNKWHLCKYFTKAKLGKVLMGKREETELHCIVLYKSSYHGPYDTTHISIYIKNVRIIPSVL